MNLLALPCGTIVGVFAMGGDTINCLLISFTFMYSLKSILIVFPEKWVS